MKFRNGYVSNSSSSSFIVVFKKIPQGSQEMFDLMFGEDEKVINLWEDSHSTVTIAETVFRDIKHIIDDTDKTPITERYTRTGRITSEEELGEMIARGSFDGLPPSPSRNDRNRESNKLADQARSEGVENPYQDKKWKEKIRIAEDKEWNDYYERSNEAARKIAASFWEEHKDKEILIFEYSDNDGSLFSTMEHGDIFRKLPHIRVSHH